MIPTIPSSMVCNDPGFCRPGPVGTDLSRRLLFHSFLEFHYASLMQKAATITETLIS